MSDSFGGRISEKTHKKTHKDVAQDEIGKATNPHCLTSLLPMDYIP